MSANSASGCFGLSVVWVDSPSACFLALSDVRAFSEFCQMFEARAFPDVRPPSSFSRMFSAFLPCSSSAFSRASSWGGGPDVSLPQKTAAYFPLFRVPGGPVFRGGRCRPLRRFHGRGSECIWHVPSPLCRVHFAHLECYGSIPRASFCSDVLMFSGHGRAFGRMSAGRCPVSEVMPLRLRSGVLPFGGKPGTLSEG